MAIRPYVLLVFCVTCWASDFVISSILLQHFSALLLPSLRLICTTLFLIGYAVFTKSLASLSVKQWLAMIPIGLIGTFVNQMSFFHGMQTTDPTIASLILALTPICTSFIAHFFLKEQLTGKLLAGSFIALIGVFFVISKHGDFSITSGIWFIVLAMLSFAVSITMMRKVTERLDVLNATAYSTAVGTMILVPAALSQQQLLEVSHHIGPWLLLGASGVLMQGICNLVWYRQVQAIGAGAASMFLNLQPFLTMMIAWGLLGTRITWIQIVGSVLVIGGIVLATKRPRQRVESESY